MGTRAEAEALFTIGYEGRNLLEFISVLRDHGVSLVVDVRQIAHSRKPGFSKGRLSAALEESGLGYEHMPELGSPKDVRHQYRQDGDHAAFFRAYARHLQAQQQALETLGDLSCGRSVALLCFEHDACDCHRSAVAAAVAGRRDLAVLNL